MSVNDIMRLVIAGPVSVDDEQSGEGSGVTWANDLSSSTDTHQFVSSISGANGTGAVCTLRSGCTILQTAIDDHTSSNYPLEIQPFDLTHSRFQVRYRGVHFNSTTDPVTFIGWNTDNGVVDQPVGYLAFEADFESVPGTHQFESYFQWQPRGDSNSGHTYRPLGFVGVMTTGVLTTFAQYAGGSFTVIGGPIGGPTAQQFTLTDGQMTLSPNDYNVEGLNGLFVSTLAGGVTLFPATTLTLRADSGAFHKHDDTAEMVWDYAGGQFRLYPVADGLGALGVGPVNRLSKVEAIKLVAGTAVLQSGVGNPNGAVVGSPGDLYMNTNGGANTTLWVKESGAATNTGWIGK